MVVTLESYHKAIEFRNSFLKKTNIVLGTE